MYSSFYKTTLFYKQQDAIQQAKDKEHSFLFAVENIDLNREGKRTYSYGSHTSVGTFLSFYNSIDDDKKHFYEVIPNDIPIYEYYDLDLKLIEDMSYTNESVLSWFKQVRKEFIKTNYLDLVRDDDFIITTSSNKSKISLHILNRSIIFNNNSSLKEWYNKLKEFVYSFYEFDPLIKTIDFSVSSSYRSMRIINSSKYGQNRPLKLLYDKDINGGNIYPIHTFITNASKDLNLETKLITLSQEIKSKISNIVYPSYDISCITELLSLLSPNRCGDYDDWIRVGWALKSSGVDINIFKDWSRDNSTTKFNRCEEIWNSGHCEGVSLGTIHYFSKLDNPKGYESFINKNKNFKVDFPFTSTLKINQKYISSDIYSNNLLNNEVIALKSNMNTGKTHCLPEIFSDYQVKVVVYFRISLNTSIYNKWKKYGFELYSDIKDDIIKTSKHKNIIVQIDSLHRIQGKVDLLLLDEIESTHEHMCGSKYIKKNKEYSSLKNMIKNTPKIIACDANLKDETINILFDKKKVISIENKYNSFSNLTCDFYFDKEALIQKAFYLLSSGKNIVIPTNSIKISENVYSIITNKFPNLKILRMNSKTAFTDVGEWSKYNVVIYTPKIVAGISFDEFHFHSVVGFFINKSCNTEPSSQMLFRVRNLIDNNMFIYTPRNTKEGYLPLEDEDIYSYLNTVIKEGKYPIDDTGLDIDKFNEKVKKNRYYIYYKAYIKKRNISRQYFYSYIKSILKNHGIKCNYIEAFISKDDKKKIKDDIRESTIELKIEDATKIVKAPIIYCDDYAYILDKREDQRTEEDIYAMKRYNLLSSYDLDVTTTLTVDWVVKSIPYAKAYKNYTLFKDQTIEESIESAEEYFDINYRRGLLDEDYISSSEDSGYEGDSEITKKKKMSLKKTLCHALTYERKFLKMKICLQLIKEAGFSSLSHKGKVKLDWVSIYNFVYKENKNISTIFDSKPFKFVSKEFDPEDGVRKKVMMEFINRRLEDWFGIRISRTNNKYDNYEIEVLFKNNLYIT